VAISGEAETNCKRSPGKMWSLWCYRVYRWNPYSTCKCTMRWYRLLQQERLSIDAITCMVVNYVLINTDLRYTQTGKTSN